jgi:arginyl-tRNA synthetase
MSKKMIQADLEVALAKQGWVGDIAVVPSQHEAFHYQSSVLFRVKKELPNWSNEDCLSTLRATGRYSSVEQTGQGFLSFKLNPSAFQPKTAPMQTVIVDYCGANMAKKMHIGHIRSMFIGDFVARVHEARGDQVHRINHAGDWGNQFGGLLAYLEEMPVFPESLEGLTQAYKEAQKKEKEDECFKLKAASVAHALLIEKQEKYMLLWRQLCTQTMKENQAVFEYFGLTLNQSHTIGESHHAEAAGQIVREGLQHGWAKTDEDGRVVCFFEDEKLPPLVLQKSNGNLLYAAYDLAAIHKRAKLNPDKIIYVVDKRQSLHFQQVFAIAKRLKWTQAKLIHIAFGAITGKNGIPLKTKEGESLYLDELMKEGATAVENLTQLDAYGAQRAAVAKATLVGGLKFYDLKMSVQKDYAFEWSSVLSFDGQSAPYMQNAYARIHGICIKAGIQMEQKTAWIPTEKVEGGDTALWFKAYALEEACDEMALEYASSWLCERLMQLCQNFHAYYQQHKVVGHSLEMERLQLLQYVGYTLSKAAKVLGIELYPSYLEQQKA